jgi:hypothetical protein
VLERLRHPQAVVEHAVESLGVVFRLAGACLEVDQSQPPRRIGFLQLQIHAEEGVAVSQRVSTVHADGDL